MGDGRVPVYGIIPSLIHSSPRILTPSSHSILSTPPTLPSASLSNRLLPPLSLQVWDMRKEEMLFTLPGHVDTVTGLSVSPDGSYLLSNSMDNTGKD